MFSRRLSVLLKIVSMFLVFCFINLYCYDIYRGVHLNKAETQAAEIPIGGYNANLGLDHQKPVELKYLRNETTKVFGNPDGTYTAETYLSPVHYKVEDRFEEIDNTLVSVRNGDAFENVANSYQVSFPVSPRQTDTTTLFNYRVGDHEITFAVENESQEKELNQFSDPKNVTGIAQDNRFEYNGLYDNVSFEYVLQGGRLKENIILDSYQGKNTFEFLIMSSGLKATSLANGAIEFTCDASGEFIFKFSPPFMYDSKEKEGLHRDVSYDVTQEITATDGGFILTLTADENYLADPARVYPVIIDPIIELYDAEDTSIRASAPGNNYYQEIDLSVGGSSHNHIWRTLARWTLPEVEDFNLEVSAASLEFSLSAIATSTDIDLHRVTDDYDPTTVTWNDQPSYQLEEETSIFICEEDPSSSYTFDISDLARDWFTGTQDNYGILLKVPQETISSGVAFFSSKWPNQDYEPKLTIHFRAKEKLGLTDYWAFTPDIFNGEGSAVVNVINGNMVYQIPVLELDSRLGAFNLSLTYNSRSSYQGDFGYGWTFSAQRRLITNPDLSIVEYINENGNRIQFVRNENDEYITPSGYYQTLTKTAPGYTLEEPHGYITYYFDELGRNYEMVDLSDNKIKYQFDGSSTRITQIQERYGNEATGRNINLEYNINGLLSKITDLNGIETVFSYNTVGEVSLLRHIFYAYNETEEKNVTFYYDQDNRIKYFEDANGNEGFVEYAQEVNRVIRIYDPRTYDEPYEEIYATLSYNHISDFVVETIFEDLKKDPATGNKTYYKSGPDTNGVINITQIIQDYQGAVPLSTQYTWERNNLIEVIDPYNRTYTADYDDNGNLISLNFMQPDFYMNNEYDEGGNLTNIETNYGETEIAYDPEGNPISVTDHYGSTGYSTYDKYGNTAGSMLPVRDAVNLLNNPDFSRKVSHWPADWQRESGASYSASSNRLFGKYSARIETYSSGSYSQEIAVDVQEEDREFTVSAHLKTYNVQGQGANIQVTFKDFNGSPIMDGGNQIIYETPMVIGTYGWTRFSRNITAPLTTAFIEVTLSLEGSGTAYFDGVQLTRGTALDMFYTSHNAGMEQGTGVGKEAVAWDIGSMLSGDGRTDDEEIFAGDYSFKINGRSIGQRGTYGQWVEISGQAGDPVTISGWSYLETEEETTAYMLELVLIRSDNSEEIYNLNFDADLFEQWQIAAKTIYAQQDFVRAKITMVYQSDSGVAYFDNIKLFEAPLTSSFTYDTYGNFLTSETDILGHTTTYSYDNNGNLLGMVDPVGREMAYTYNALNLLTTATHKAADPFDDIVATYTYDKRGNLKYRTDPRGYITEYKYDAISQGVKEIDPLGKYISYSYDALGNMTTLTRGKDTSVKSTEEYIYDSLNRLQEKKVNSNTVFSIEYDDTRGNIEEVNVPGLGSYNYDYNNDDLLVEIQTPQAFTLEYSYDTEMTGMRTGYKETINSTSWDTLFGYDTQHRLTSIQGPGNIATPGGTVGFEYTDLSAVARLNLGITEMQLDYDPMGRLTAQTLYSPMQRKYIENTYYPDGKVHTYTQDNVVYSYTYDFAGRLIEWDNGSPSPVTYSYDKAGNLLNPKGKSLTFNEANEISNTGYIYDDAGNLKQDEKYKYDWDGEGRLSTVTTLADVTIADYSYHYDGLRKSKTVGSDIYNYHYDGSNLIRITDENEETVWAITWSGMSPVMLTNAAGETYYYVTNYRGDVVNILDEDGYPVASYRYDPWGNPEYIAEAASVAGQPIRYASYVYDSETGHYYLKARYYDPETARFISRDAVWGVICSPLSQNQYGYCEGDPVNYVDPDGLWRVEIYSMVVHIYLTDKEARDWAFRLVVAAILLTALLAFVPPLALKIIAVVAAYIYIVRETILHKNYQGNGVRIRMVLGVAGPMPIVTGVFGLAKSYKHGRNSIYNYQLYRKSKWRVGMKLVKVWPR